MAKAKLVVEKLYRARTRVMLNYPFFSFLLFQLRDRPMTELEENTMLGPMGTDGRNIIYSPKWVEACPDNELAGVLVHEVLHPALGDLWRKGTRDQLIWNVAADYVNNAIIMESIAKESNPGMILPDGCLYNKKFDGKSKEEIYEILLKEAEKAGDGLGKESGKGGGDKFCAGTGLGDKSDGQSKNEAASVEGIPDGENLREYWNDKLTQAACYARQMGKLPGGMESIIDNVLQPRVPWKMLLARYVQAAITDDYRIIPPHKNHVYRGIYLPTEYGETIDFAVAADTSGSISDEQLREFVSEMLGMCRVASSFKMHYFSCDAAVHDEREITRIEDLPTRFKGRGGTDFRPVFDRIEERKMNPTVLVYFTDLCGSFPTEAPKYPVIWLVLKGDKNQQPPFGTRIDYDSYVQ